jgi:hypothetical protein
MSKQQLAAILEMSAQKPIPANATPAAMRAWVEDVAGHLPVAENIQIERVNSMKAWRPSKSTRRSSRRIRPEVRGYVFVCAVIHAQRVQKQVSYERIHRC